MPTIRRQFSPAFVNATLAGLLAIALYAISIGGTYVYDDIPVIRSDRRMQEPIRWKLLWTRSYNGGVDQLYRPLTSTTYALQLRLHGDLPWAFHLVNILLHASASVCVAELARRLFGTRVGLISGLLFAAHPIHVEAVANIVGRAELLCGLCMLTAVVLSLKKLTAPRAFAIGVLFIISVLCKEQGLLLPLLLVLLILLLKWKFPTEPLGTKNGLLTFSTVLLWFLASYLIWREQMFRFWWNRNDLDWTINPLIRSTGIHRLLVPLELLGRYTTLLIAPFKLSPDYSANIIEPFAHYREPFLYIGIIALLAWFGLLIFAWRKRFVQMLFLLLALALTYGLIANVIMLIGTSMAERLMYVPSAFFIILAAAGISKVLPKKIPLALVLIPLLALASLRTVTYAARWNDSIQLFEAALKDQPRSIKLHMLLADDYLKQKQLDKAQAVNDKGRELMPDYWDIWFQAGQIAALQGDFDKAKACFEKSMELESNRYAAAWLSELPRRRAAATRSSTTSVN